MTYAEKLLDPRWQKKRLKILERDNWTCRKCGDVNSSLHVHHLKYKYGKSPWEYPQKDLITLCKDCHKEITEDSTSLKRALEVLKVEFIENDKFDSSDIWNFALDLIQRNKKCNPYFEVLGFVGKNEKLFMLCKNEFIKHNRNENKAQKLNKDKINGKPTT